MTLSVTLWRLSLRRARDAQSRNPRRCKCTSPSEVHVQTATLGTKRIRLSQHGALHGVFGHEGCPHSELALTTNAVAPNYNKVLYSKPLHSVAERKAKMRRLAALPNIPVIILGGVA